MSCLLYVLPVVEVVYGSHYLNNNETCCQSDFNISIPEWLVIDGSSGLLFYTVFLYIIIYKIIYEDKLSISYIFAVTLFILSSLFKVAWIVVGSILFWRDCININPKQLNSIMWAVLLISIISMIIANSKVV